MRKDIALVLTGHMRMFKEGHASIKKNILDRVSSYDVFIHTWSDIGFYSGKGYLKPGSDGFIRLDENDLGYHPSGDIPITEIRDLYHPVQFVIEDFPYPIFKQRAERYTKAYTRPMNTVSQYYKIQQGLKLLFQYSADTETTYNLVFRTRPDLIVQTQMPSVYNPNIVYTNRGSNSKGIGFGDQLQISSITNMVTISELYSHIPELYDELGYSCPHAYLQRWLEKNNVHHDNLPTDFMIMHGPYGPYKEPDTGKEHVPTR